MRAIFILFFLWNQFVFTSHAEERLYVHFDRTEFRAGDSVRFKAYVLWEGLPSARSTHFYIQVFNERGTLVSMEHFPVFGATVDGGFSLPDSLSTGNYYIQAFTPLLLRSGARLYVKNIWVDARGFRSAAKASGKLSRLAFFPEGGSMHADQLNLIVFRSTDASGNPVSVSGVIQNSDGQTVAPFQTILPGLGVVRFKARKDVTYRAVVDSSQFSVPLPAAVSGSIQLKIESEQGGKKFQLSRNPKSSFPRDLFRLTARTRGQIVYDQEISFGAYPSLIGHLVTDSLPSGILLFDLFDAEGNLLVRRPCFIDRGEWEAPVRLQPIPMNHASTSDTSTVELLLADSVMTSLSLSVMNADISFPDESMLSRLLLLNDQALQPADVSRFLLENHWNANVVEWLLMSSLDRFTPPTVDTVQLVAEATAYLYMSGTVFDARSEERMIGGDLTVVLETDSGDSKQWSLVPNDKGWFSIDSIVYSGMGSFYAYYADKKGKLRTVRVDARVQGFDSVSLGLSPANLLASGQQQKSPVRFDEGVIGEPMAKLLDPLNLDRSGSKLRGESVDEKYTTGVFREAGKVTIDNVNNPVTDKSINVIDYIKNRIQQVELQGGRFVNRKNMSLSSGQKWQIGLFLNEQPVEMNSLRTIRAMDVALIKFYEAGFVGSGSNYPGGALAIYLKEKSENGSGRSEIPFFRGKGFSKWPVAGKPVSGHEARMLYWDPTLLVDQARNRISFPIPSNISRYRLVLSGFDLRGRLVWIEEELEK